MSEHNHNGDTEPTAGQAPDLDDTRGPSDETLELLLRGAHKPPRIDPSARARILEDLVSNQQQLVARKHWWQRALQNRRARIGAVLTLAAAALVALLLSFPKQATVTSYENVGLGPKRVALSDGSTLLLERGARVVALADRKLRLDAGKVLLDVVKGKKPFVIESAHGSAVVLGTRFVLNREATQTKATVIRGKVKVESSGGSELIGAGEEGVLKSGSVPQRRPAPRLTYVSAWARTLLSEQPSSKSTTPARRGTLLARAPGWGKEWPLPIRKLNVDVHIEDNVARTTIDQTFFNHVNRQLEGRFTFPLPSGAAISRLAMYVDGRLVEGGIVERERGRFIYESIVERRRDPALLEWMKGNQFRIRIFPLPARSEKRIVLSYTQTLASLYDTTRLAVPMPQIDAPVGRTTFTVRVAKGEGYELRSSSHPVSIHDEDGDRVARFEANEYTLGDDLLLTLQAEQVAASQVARFSRGDEAYLLARAPSGLKGSRKPAPRRWVVLYDTSASRHSQALAAQGFMLRRLLQEWDEDDTVAVLAFDTMTRLFGDGFTRVGDFDLTRLASWLREEASDNIGETNLERALAKARKLLEDGSGTASGDRGHVLYLGDGMATGGQASLAALQQQLGDKTRFVGVALGDSYDETLLAGLAENSDGLFVALSQGEDLSWAAFDLVATLNSPRVLRLSAELLDAQDKPIDGAQIFTTTRQLAPGDWSEVIAKLPSKHSARTLRLRGTLDNEPWERRVELVAGSKSASYLARRWARRRIAALEREEITDRKDGTKLQVATKPNKKAKSEKPGPKEEITALGLEHFLVTRHTSLLVLENDAMYRRFKVSRAPRNSWARYPAPPRIVSKREPLEAQPLAAGTMLLRTPVRRFAPSRGVRYSATWGWGGNIWGQLGLIGAGHGGGGRGFGSGFGGRLPRVRMGAATAAADVPNVLLVFDGSGSMNTRLSPVSKIVSTEELLEADQHVSWRGTERKKTKRSARAMGPRLADKATTWWESSSGEGRGGVGRSILQPSKLRHARDARLADLTEHVPALMSDSIDEQLQRLLLARAAGATGSLSDSARQLLQAALKKQTGAHYGLAGGGTLRVAKDGSIDMDRVTHSGLTEQWRYDGVALEVGYPELDLVARRQIGAGQALLLARLAPFVLPRLAKLEQAYRVSLKGERTLVLEPAGTLAKHRIELQLDEQLRVIRTVLTREGKPLLDVRVHYEKGEQITLERQGGATLRLSRQATGSTMAAIKHDKDTAVVLMPLRDPTSWQQQLDRDPVSDARWRQVQQQLIATHVALGDDGKLRQVAEAIAKRFGALSRGELALGSRLARSVTSKVMKALSEHLAADDPLAIHLRAGSALGSGRANKALHRAGEQLGLIGMLGRYRLTLLLIEQGNLPAARAAYDVLMAKPLTATLRYIATYLLASQYRWSKPKQESALWDGLASAGVFRVDARLASARALSDAGSYQRAAQRLEQGMMLAAEQNRYPIIDWRRHRAFMASPGGNVAWRGFWRTWRSKLLASRKPEALLSLMLSMQQTGLRDHSALLATLPKVDVSDPWAVTSLAAQLAQSGRVHEAASLVSAALEHQTSGNSGDVAELLGLAGALAERQGRHADAIGYFERSLDAGEGPMQLTTLRSIYRRLFELHLAAGRGTASGSAKTLPLGGALGVARRWRRLDPDNPQIDTLCATTLYAHGQPEQAWRHLSSILERHPGEGSAYAQIAELLEKEGLLRRAEAIWTKAIEVEPTNPTWLLRGARLQLALRNEAKAAQLLGRIAKGRWQERFDNVVRQAKELL